MQLSTIIAHCKKVKNYFKEGLSLSPLDAALLLGNLLLMRKKATQSQRHYIEHKLSKIKPKLNTLAIKNLWKVAKSNLYHYQIKDNKTQRALRLVQEYFVCDIDYAIHLDRDDLLDYGKEVNQYRLVLVALIRRYLRAHHLADPFQNNFSFSALQSAGVSQNYLYLSPFLKQCADFPSWDIIQLGQKDSDIAFLILADLYNSECFLEVSIAFVKCHPALRAKIAKQWQDMFEHYPLEQKQKAAAALAKVSVYPEFKQVKLNQRISRDHTEVVIDNPETGYIVWGMNLSLSLGKLQGLLVTFSRVLTLGSAVYSGVGVYSAALGVCQAAVPLALPVATAKTLTWLASHRSLPSETKSLPERASQRINYG